MDFERGAKKRRMATVIAAAAALGGLAFAGRMAVRYWPAVSARLGRGAVATAASSSSAASASSAKFYNGGFEEKMSLAEAALILNVRQSASLDKIKAAHRKLMVLNHPDNGGSHYVASKVNEAKDFLVKNHHEETQ